MPKIINNKFYCDCGKWLCNVGANPQDVIIHCKFCKRDVEIKLPKIIPDKNITE